MNALNKDLNGQNFDGQNLSGSLFRGANLSNCSFVGSVLSSSNLIDTNIEGCDFTDAIMYYVNIKGATGVADFTRTRTHGMPKWIDMPGSNTLPPLTDEEYQNNTAFITAVFAQANMTVALLDEIDTKIVNDYISGFIEHIVLSKDYQDVIKGNNLYLLLGIDDDGDLRSLKTILELCEGMNVLVDNNGQFYVKDKIEVI